MRYWLLALVFLLSLERAYAVGKSIGIKTAPEYAAARVEVAEISAELWREAEANTSDRELMCDRFIDEVKDLLAEEYLTER